MELNKDGEYSFPIYQNRTAENAESAEKVAEKNGDRCFLNQTTNFKDTLPKIM